MTAASGNASPGTPDLASRRRAVIDVGTNSVKLLIAVVRDGVVTPLHEQSRQTRLGEGFFKTRLLADAAIARTVEAIDEFLATARPFEPESIRLIATAAAREAGNRDALITAVRDQCGADLRVIDGDTEARWAFQGVNTGPESHGGDVLVTDLGGGSTEFILGRDRERLFGKSYPLGANRLFETVSPGDPPGLQALAGCRTHLDSYFQEHILPDIDLVRHRHALLAPLYRAVGGTAVILGRIVLGMAGFDRDRIEARAVSAGELSLLTEKLWSSPLEERKTWVGLPPERADIILTGSALHEAILRNLGLSSLRPSTRGARFAALLEPE